MAEKAKSNGSAKRYGARYGRTIRAKLNDIERPMRSKQKCPYCRKDKVKRVSLGIWYCRGCNTKFTGDAYAIKREIKEVEQ